MGALQNLVKTIGVARLAAMGAVGAFLIGFFIFVVLRLSQPQMAVLYTDLTVEDSSAIVAELDSRGVPYELRNEGATILVPDQASLRLRLAFAEEGLPAGGTVGYEIFDKGNALGATSFVQNINRLRALEGELARTIRSLSQVQHARVHLVLPQRELFSRDEVEPSASIVLKVRGELTSTQTRAVQHLVASAVKGLKPTRVAIVDETGRLLASGDGDDDTTIVGASMEERRLALQERLKTQIEDIVSSIVGRGNARVQVTAELDLTQVTQTQDVFDPEGQVVRSTQRNEETTSAVDATRNRTVTVANELPNADDSAAADAGGSRENANRIEEVINYEISRTTRTEVTGAGRIKRISVAVLVDGIHTKAGDGSIVYQPRPQEQLDQLAALVRSAIGFDRARGDQVEVVNLQFTAGPSLPPEDDVEEGYLNLSKQDYLYLAELAAMVLLGLLLLLLVLRPLVRRILTPEEQEQRHLQQALPPGDLPQLLGPDGEPVSSREEPEQLTFRPESRTAALIDVVRQAGELHENSLTKIGDMVRANPEEAVAIIRNWLQEKAA